MNNAMPQATHAPRRSGALWFADALVVLAIAVWAVGASNLPEVVLPGPVAVGKRLLALFTDSEFLVHTVASTVRVIGPSEIVGCVPAKAFGRMTRGTLPNEALYP
jgi:NitT/TauT family transport system permease protein/sulfonate transport system permease protein